MNVGAAQEAALALVKHNLLWVVADVEHPLEDLVMLLKKLLHLKYPTAESQALSPIR